MFVEESVFWKSLTQFTTVMDTKTLLKNGLLSMILYRRGGFVDKPSRFKIGPA